MTVMGENSRKNYEDIDMYLNSTHALIAIVVKLNRIRDKFYTISEMLSSDAFTWMKN